MTSFDFSASSDQPSPLQRVLVAADFGNGISGVLDYERFVFINPDLTVYVRRPPAGVWVGLDAETWLEPGGGGYAESALYDEGGRIGRAFNRARRVIAVELQLHQLAPKLRIAHVPLRQVRAEI